MSERSERISQLSVTAHDGAGGDGMSERSERISQVGATGHDGAERSEVTA
ncbi:hypothetical protein [Micromonospora sp. NPDC048830]